VSRKTRALLDFVPDPPASKALERRACLVGVRNSGRGRSISRRGRSNAIRRLSSIWRRIVFACLSTATAPPVFGIRIGMAERLGDVRREPLNRLGHVIEQRIDARDPRVSGLVITRGHRDILSHVVPVMTGIVGGTNSESSEL
jgi:hypothetical protein